RHAGRDLADFAILHQVGLALRALAAEPRFDDTFRERLRAVGQGEVVIDADDSPEAAAGRAGAERVIKTEQCGGGFAVFNVAWGAVETVAEVVRRAVKSP